MMRRLTALLLAACLLLSGCSTWMDGSYVSITPHMEQQNNQNQNLNWISDVDELYEAICTMVNSGRASDLFYIRNYGPKTVSVDMRQVEYRIKSEDPIGAYAVEGITYEVGVNGGQSTLAVSIEYSHSRAEILRIQKVVGLDVTQKAIHTALNQLKSELVLYVENYQEADFTQIVEDYAQQEPDVVMEIPQVSVAVYPKQGDERVVEIKFTYQTSRDSLRTMQSQVKQVFESAKLYINNDEMTHEKYAHLFSFLMERFDYKLDTSITPTYSLLRYGVGNSKAFAVVFAEMCRQVGLECLTVSGTRDGEPWFWNIIREDDAYCHVDLLRCEEEGEFREYSDSQMSGYVWDYSEYPACDRTVIPENDQPNDGLQSEENGETSVEESVTEMPTEEPAEETTEPAATEDPEEELTEPTASEPAEEETATPIDSEIPVEETTTPVEE